MADLAHWRTYTGEAPPSKEISRLAQFCAMYAGGRTALEHNLHLNRALRDRTDRLRTWPDLPPEERPPRVKWRPTHKPLARGARARSDRPAGPPA